MDKKLIVLGGGGHAKVVIATARAAGFEVVGVLDDDVLLQGGAVLNVPIVGRIDKLNVPHDTSAVIAIGSNELRQSLVQRVGCPWGVVVHPTAVLHDTVVLGGGTVVFAGVVVQPSTVIGHHTILNTASSVDHDCVVGDFVHVAPGVRLAGGCTVGTGSFLGIGAVVVPGIRVGSWSTIGAGAVVVEDVPDRVVAVGVPARVVRRLG